MTFSGWVPSCLVTFTRRGSQACRLFNKADYYGIEIENGPLDGISTLFVWFGEHCSYIGLCSHHGQTETIWSSVLGQGHTSKAPALCPCRLAARISWFSISPEPIYADQNRKPNFDKFRVARDILPLSRLISVLAYTLCHIKPNFDFDYVTNQCRKKQASKAPINNSN